MNLSSSLRARALLPALFLAACSDPAQLAAPPSPTPWVPMMEDAGPPDLPDYSLLQVPLRVSSVEPENGSFAGGTEVLIRGRGFDAGEELPEIFFGGRAVQAPDIEVVDDRRIRVIVPAGEVGPADVAVELADGRRSVLPEGYHYDPFAIEPGRGATAGGYRVQLIGAAETIFDEADQVFLGVLACTEVQLESPSILSCRVPAGAPGPVDVRLVPANPAMEEEGGEPDIEIRVADGFEYFDSSDPFDGGLGGGPIRGQINVTVLDDFTGEPIPGALAIVGTDPNTELRGITNASGQTTISGPDLAGPVTLTVAAECFAKTSFVAFDARDVTTFMTYVCPPPPPEGPPPVGGVGREGSYVQGELVFLGPNEFGPNPWDIVPTARPGWVRVAYVAVAQPCAGDGGCRNPSASIGGLDRVLEDDRGALGYPYRIFMRPGSYAVYALAGLERESGGDFRPYVMGVARNILVGPGEELLDTNVIMNIPLDQLLEVRPRDLPPRVEAGPDRFFGRSAIDLGGEGIIERRAYGNPIDLAEERLAGPPLRFYAQPALSGAVVDGRFRVQIDWVSGALGGNPSSHVVLQGVRRSLDVDSFLGVPIAVSPTDGARLRFDADGVRRLRWQRSGGEVPDFHYVRLLAADGSLAWELFVPGDLYEVELPDLSSFEGIDDIGGGTLEWSVTAINIDDFEFDRVTYRALSESRWREWAVDDFTLQL